MVDIKSSAYNTNVKWIKHMKTHLAKVSNNMYQFKIKKL